MDHVYLTCENPGEIVLVPRFHSKYNGSMLWQAKWNLQIVPRFYSALEVMKSGTHQGYQSFCCLTKHGKARVTARNSFFDASFKLPVVQLREFDVPLTKIAESPAKCFLNCATSSRCKPMHNLNSGKTYLHQQLLLCFSKVGPARCGSHRIVYLY